MWRMLCETADELALSMNKVFRPAAFRAGGEGAPPTFEALVREQEARPPEIRWPATFERRPGRLRVRAPVAGTETFADFHPARSREADTLFVFHHGLGEPRHDASAWALLARGAAGERVDRVAIKAPLHETPAAAFERLLESEESFARAILSSVFTARAIGERLRSRYRHVVLGGVSLGGVVSLIAAALPPVFDLHIPLLAGPDLDAVVARSAFSRVVSRRFLKRCAGGRFGGALDLSGRLGGAGGPPIRAALGAWDRLFELGPQRAAYARIPRAAVEVVWGGHVTGAARLCILGDFVERTLERELWGARTSRESEGKPSGGVDRGSKEDRTCSGGRS